MDTVSKWKDDPNEMSSVQVVSTKSIEDDDKIDESRGVEETELTEAQPKSLSEDNKDKEKSSDKNENENDKTTIDDGERAKDAENKEDKEDTVEIVIEKVDDSNAIISPTKVVVEQPTLSIDNVSNGEGVDSAKDEKKEHDIVSSEVEATTRTVKREGNADVC